jgi:hypothetical protein
MIETSPQGVANFVNPARFETPIGWRVRPHTILVKGLPAAVATYVKP